MYACSISGLELHPALNWSSTWLWYCSSLFRVSAWSWSRGKAPGYVTVQTENFCDNLNWIMYLRATACLHCHCTDNSELTSEAQNCNQSCSWGKSHETQMGNSCTLSLLHHWPGLNMTTIPLCPVYLECVLSIRRPLIGGLRRTDRRTDGQKSPNNCSNPSIRLCFAPRVNKTSYMSCLPKQYR